MREIKRLQNNYIEGDTTQKYRAQEDFYNYIKNKHHRTMKIYHYSRCSKCRAALKYLEEKNIEVNIVKYFEEPLNEEQLRNLLKKMPDLKAFDLVRTHENLYKEEYKDKELTDEQWIKVLVENPQLLKRPIVEFNDKAIVAIPAVEVEKIL